MVFFLRSFFAQTLLNGYFIYRIHRSGELSKSLKWVLTAVYVLESLMYFTGLLCSERLSFEAYSRIQEISGIWVIAHIYIVVLLTGFDLAVFLKRRFGWFRRIREKQLKTIKISTFVLFFLFICTQLYVGYDNFLHPEVRTFAYAYNKPEADDAQPKARYKLLLMSDLHLGYIINQQVLRKYVDIIQAQQADIIVIDGDLIDYTLRPLIAKHMEEELRRIRAPKGVYFVPGNHEYKMDPQIRFDWIRNLGMTVLKDSVVTIDRQLQLIGRDDRKMCDERLPIDSLMKKADLSKPSIFLAHQPGDLREAYEYRIPLSFYGHTHGGQVFPINLIGKLMYSQVYGLRTRKACTSYVTSGLGLSGFPLRIATHSEIVVFDIEIY